MFQYSINLRWSDEDEGYVAEVPELPGVSAVGETPEEAVHEVQDAAQACIESLREDGLPVPAPRKIPHYSGQLRLGCRRACMRSWHRWLRRTESA
jgi:predicted RNase H-like HicB family nuclease